MKWNNKQGVNMNQMWNDNLSESVIADLMNGVGATNKGKELRRPHVFQTVDQLVKHCPKCRKLWELRMSFGNPVIYVPTCNAITRGKKEKICPNCQ
jgi:hypothetical protein